MEHLGEIVESLALARPIADRTQQAERLSQELHRCVGPAQRLVSAPEVVQGPSLARLVPDLALDSQPIVQVGQGRVQSSKLEPHSTHVGQGDADGRAPADLAQDEQGLAVVGESGVVLTEQLERQGEVVEGYALAPTIPDPSPDLE